MKGPIDKEVQFSYTSYPNLILHAITPPKPKKPNASKRKRDSPQRPGVNSKAKPAERKIK